MDEAIHHFVIPDVRRVASSMRHEPYDPGSMVPPVKWIPAKFIPAKAGTGMTVMVF